MLQLFNNVFTLFCDPQKYELIKMDTDSLYMALSEEKAEDLIRPETELLWQMNRVNDCREDFRADEHYKFFPRNLSAASEIRSEDTWSLQRGI